MAVAPSSQIQHDMGPPAFLFDDLDDAIRFGLLFRGRHRAHHQVRGQRIRLHPRGFELRLGRFDVLRLLGQIVQHTQEDRPGLVLRGKLLGVFQLGGDPGMLQACPKPGQVGLGEQQPGMFLACQGTIG